MEQVRLKGRPKGHQLWKLSEYLKPGITEPGQLPGWGWVGVEEGEWMPHDVDKTVHFLGGKLGQGPQAGSPRSGSQHGQILGRAPLCLLRSSRAESREGKWPLTRALFPSRGPTQMASSNPRDLPRAHILLPSCYGVEFQQRGGGTKKSDPHTVSASKLGVLRWKGDEREQFNEKT